MTGQAGEDTITRGLLTYTVVPLDAVLDIATGFRRTGRRWHSHVLSPGCVHNPYATRFAIVVEDDDDGRAYISASTVFPEVDRSLVKMLHGDTILDRSRPSALVRTRPGASTLPVRVADIDGHHIAWHHHMHFPGCALSPRPDLWTIAVESDKGDFFETFDGEPVDVLRELEVLYFTHVDDGSSGA